MCGYVLTEIELAIALDGSVPGAIEVVVDDARVRDFKVSLFKQY